MAKDGEDGILRRRLRSSITHALHHPAVQDGKALRGFYSREA